MKKFLASEKAAQEEAEKLIEKQNLERQLAREAKDQSKEKCEVCGKVRSFFVPLHRTPDGRNLCSDHHFEWLREQFESRENTAQQQQLEMNLRVDSVVLSTTPTLEGYRIKRYLVPEQATSGV